MPAGKLVACEPYGSLGIIGSQGAVVFLEGGAPGGRSTRGVLCSSVRKVMKVATSPSTAGGAGDQCRVDDVLLADRDANPSEHPQGQAGGVRG